MLQNGVYVSKFLPVLATGVFSQYFWAVVELVLVIHSIAKQICRQGSSAVDEDFVS